MKTGSATKSDKQVDKVTLRVMVDKERNRVLYAEAEKDFVDVLFSFLTMPLGTIARLVAKESNIEAVQFGSISSLYQSVSDLNEKYLCSHTSKEMLLQPINSMEIYWQKLKLNVDDTKMQYLVCKDFDCLENPTEILLSFFGNKKCYCGNILKKNVCPNFLNLENGFVKENATFIICDDLHVIPNVFGASLHLLQKLGVDTFDAVEEQTVDIDKKEVIDLLKLSFLSSTPLTHFIFKKNDFTDNLNLRNKLEFLIGDLPSDDNKQMSVKITVRKSNEQILFAEAEEDFVDFVFSFLTFPLGGVMHMLQGFSSIFCIDNLYKSITNLSPDRYLMSEEVKEKLSKPQIFPQFDLSDQILPIGATSLSAYFFVFYGLIELFAHSSHITEEMAFSNIDNYFDDLPYKLVPFKLVDLKSSIEKSLVFARGPLTYMVTDDLVVTPMSSMSAMSYLKRAKVPLSDLEERVIKIGVKEGLSILKASLISKSALHCGLKQFIRTIKVEK